MTPRQTSRALKAAEDRRTSDEQTRRWHTWHAAALPKLKTFPSFKEFAPAEESKPPRGEGQPVDQQITVLKGILGGRRS